MGIAFTAEVPVFTPHAANGRLRGLSVVALLVFTGACTADVPSAPRTSRPELAASKTHQSIAAGLGGFVVLNDNGEEAVIGAVKYTDGTVVGFASGNPVGGLNGPVVELVPPSGAVDFWCANMAVANVPALQGFNLLLMVRDVGNGHTSFDEVATNGAFGLTCAAGAGTAFAAVKSGDFVGTVR